MARVRRVLGTTAAAAVLLMGSLVLGTPMPPAAACSCGTGAAWEEASWASSALIVDEAQALPSSGDAERWEAEVVEVVEGRWVGETIELRQPLGPTLCGSADDPSSLGRFGVVLRSEDQDEVILTACTKLFTPEELRAALAPLPSPDGSGAAGFVAVGSIRGHPGLVLDRRGRPLRYLDVDLPAAIVAPCPGTDRVASASDGVIALWDATTGEEIVRDYLPGRPLALHCVDGGGPTVLVEVASEQPTTPVSTMAALWDGTWVHDVVLGLGIAPVSTAVVGGVPLVLGDDGGLRTVDVADGAVTTVWEAPDGVAGMALVAPVDGAEALIGAHHPGEVGAPDARWWRISVANRSVDVQPVPGPSGIEPWDLHPVDSRHLLTLDGELRDVDGEVAGSVLGLADPVAAVAGGRHVHDLAIVDSTMLAAVEGSWGQHLVVARDGGAPTLVLDESFRIAAVVAVDQAPAPPSLTDELDRQLTAAPNETADDRSGSWPLVGAAAAVAVIVVLGARRRRRSALTPSS